MLLWRHMSSKFFQGDLPDNQSRKYDVGTYAWLFLSADLSSWFLVHHILTVPSENQRRVLIVMLICAYIELILPIFTIGGSFLFKNDAKHIWGSNLPGLGCITAGSIYLALYYGNNLEMEANGTDTHMMFKAHVGIAIAMCIIGALLIIQVTLSFIGVLMCGDCCSGERAVGLFAYIFTMIGLAIVFCIPIGSMAIGWTYAFGDCSDEETFKQVTNALAVCPSIN